MSAAPNAPIIVKRKKIIAGGHHGGAWKVAYADFVTAMMAFFLLMWLLGATNEKQRKGIADYFNPTIPVNKISGGGDGAFGGESVFVENSLAHSGTGASMLHAVDGDEARGSTGVGDNGADAKAAEDGELREIEEALNGFGGESFVTELLARHVVTRLSDEGLIVEIFDMPGTPLFAGDQPTDALAGVIAAVSEVFRLSENRIAVQAHTAAVPVVSLVNPVWELSAARANTARGLLQDAGTDPERIQRVTGFGDRQPVTRDPLGARNNRIEVILLRERI